MGIPSALPGLSPHLCGIRPCSRLAEGLAEPFPGAASRPVGRPSRHLLHAIAAFCRHCVVGGVPSPPILPLRGLPRCTCCPPWCGASGQNEQRLAFVDDRTIVVQGPHPEACLAHAVACATSADRSIGVAENLSQRQEWVAGQNHPVEHLGLKVYLGDPSALTLPRDDWSAVEEVINRLSAITGTANVRERLASAFVLPKARWGCPFTSPPPGHCARALFRAILSTRCTCWCQGRWWVQRIQLHPVLGTAVYGLQRVSRYMQYTSAFLLNAAACYADKLGMRVISLDAPLGLVLELFCDARLLHLTRRATKPPRAGPRVFCADTPDGAHVLRQATRLQALNSIPATRLDREGLETLDLEASSHPTWIRWLKSLSHDQAALLNVFRSPGAVWAPTRRHAYRNSLFTACPFCAETRCSARHLFAECSHFNGARRSLEFRWHAPPNFWLSQPRLDVLGGW